MKRDKDIREAAVTKKSAILQFSMVFLIIILLNVIGNYFFFRIDLTAEKRYTLSEQTKKILRELDDIVFFEVYLEGEFPAGFKRLRQATIEMLDQFRAYSPNIQYEFINPSESSDPAVRNDIYKRLAERGLNPTDLMVNTRQGKSQQIIFPGTMVTFRSKEVPVDLLISQKGVSPEEILNNSVQNLEFNLTGAIKRLTAGIKPKVAFIEGHGELNEFETADAFYSLGELFQVERVRMDGKLSSLTERKQVDSAKTVIRNKYEAIIIAGPDSAFSEKDKFIIDQYIMRGGKVLWLIDPVFASMDSIQEADATVGIMNKLNLDDQFFNYGIRLNTELVMDLSALAIPVRTGNLGGNPQIEFFPWFYFPLLNPMGEHPVVRNLNLIKTEFISSIDTLYKPGVRKEILLSSSEYSRKVGTPVIISLDILKKDPDVRLYNNGRIPVAALLEGEFESLYRNRVPPEIADSREIGFISKSEPGRMIFIADGDVIKNQLRNTEGRIMPYPLGYDRYTDQFFGNKDLIMNAVNYLVDEEGIISLRSRELKLRLLDNQKFEKSRTKWILLNTALPVLFVVFFGIIIIYFRKRKYS
ncbi:MAG: gliding motility-associated ABC transporter substrate-binding protein GldG [Bacteroidales bacterium]|nr:gliding motility-associated ABC transporter substrate-binding protein GldG [Bacteroidales bacterium]